MQVQCLALCIIVMYIAGSAQSIRCGLDKVRQVSANSEAETRGVMITCCGDSRQKMADTLTVTRDQ